MNINRQNYEEFFLMYVDKELSAAQRTEVETFVQLNPDLSEELAMLQESVLVPDDLVFTGKDSLLKDEHSININNYEAYFLLDVDNELNTTEKAEVEKFVLQHPKLQDEYTLLHQTKLEPEVIEFKDMASLYRTEEKERRIIPMRFMRFAVAASVIGLIATLWMVYPDKKDQPQIASTEKPAVTKPNDAATAVQPAEDQTEKAEQTATNQNLVAVQKPQNGSKTNSVSVEKAPVTKVVVKEPVREEMIAYQPKQNIETREVETRIIETEPEPEPINVSNKNISANNNIARPAVYKEVDEEDDRSFYIGSAEINRNKLRGLIKKASTLFDKKAKSNDSERTIQIASFEIKTR